MDIMNMTLNQIVQTIENHPIKDVVLLLALDNVAIAFCAKMKWTAAETILQKASNVLVAMAQKYAPAATKVAPVLIIMVLMSGCASSGANGFCGRISGQGLTVPYVGGKANVDGYNCHVGCVGKCTPDVYSALTAEMKSYADSQTTNGQIMTTGPGTVQFIPGK